MKSIQSKFLIMIISGMLILAISITSISLIYIGRVLNDDSDVITESIADTEALRINHFLKDVEYAVKTMENYTTQTLNGKAPNMRVEYNRKSFIDAATSAFYAPLENIEGAMSFYFRFDTDFVDAEYAGLYVGKPSEQSRRFVEKHPVDVADWYGEWFDQARDRGTMIWIEPYTCNNIGIEIISCVSPIYVDNNFVGVLGVDVAFSKLTNMVDQISVYDNGFAYLSSNDKMLYAPDARLVNQAESLDHEYAEERNVLYNGMTLIIHADYSDIQSDSYRMTMLIVAIVLFILTCFIVITYILTKKITSPLREITVAAGKLANGETDLHFAECKTKDEVGVLASAFEKTAEKLGGYMNYINALAYKDSLTGVKNRTAYNEAATELDLLMELGDCDPFAVMVADINGLKKANDRYGHEIGNKLIIKASKIICDVFKHSPIYRIGGDEFVAILRGSDFENRFELLAAMDEQYSKATVEAGEETIVVTVARALEECDLGSDFSFDDVFNRADKKMYEHKNLTKSKAILPDNKSN